MKCRILIVLTIAVFSMCFEPEMISQATGQMLISEEKMPRSGRSGVDSTFTPDDDMTLRISGTGKVEDIEIATDESILTSRYAKNVKKIIVEDGITSLDDRVFEYFYNVTEIILPSTLEEIGKETFFDCESLRYLPFRKM